MGPHPAGYSDPSFSALVGQMCCSTAEESSQDSELWAAVAAQVDSSAAEGTVGDGLTSQIAGDLDADGIVGSSDVDLIRATWGACAASGGLLAEDANGDGTVGSADLDIIRANYRHSAAALMGTPIAAEAANSAPVAEADAYSVDEDTELTVDSAGGVLANDTDADGDTLEAVLVAEPEHGEITLNTDGSFEYTPDEGYYGTDSFTYYATDGKFTSELSGDLDGDGLVGSPDLDEIRANWGLTVTPGDLSSGDANGDGVVGSDDLDVVRANWGQQATLTASAETTVTITVNQAGDTGVTYIELNGDSISVDGTGAVVDGSTVTISSARTYSISGTLNDGQIIVETDDEEDVILLLNGVNITCSDSAPIYVINSSDTVITTAAGTENYVTDGATYNLPEGVTEPDAAIFSNDDLIFNGTGSLTVTGNFNNGIASSDDIDINCGTITVTAVNNGIKGKDSVVMLDGTVTVNSDGDGIKSNNDEDPEKGYVIIAGGTLDVTAGSDGIQAETTLTISGGDITVSAGSNGLEAAVEIIIEAGTIDPVSVNIDSTGDAVHSDDIVTISGGNLTLATGDDAIRGESAVAITGGDIDITACYEGIEAASISIDGGTIDIVSTNDGISATSVDGISSVVSVSGGTITIDAGEDGIQAEAELLVSGGTFNITTGGGSSMSVGEDESAKALKSDVALTVTDGTFTINSADDAVHSNDTVAISGGDFTIATGDDGVHAETSITIDGGDIDITKCYEGIESLVITINNGTIRIVSSDDGINVAGGADGSGDPFPTNPDQVTPGAILEMNGGYVAIYAQGDGCDSNGSVDFTGGTMIVHGPTANNNGALDCNGTFEISGGFLVAVGSVGMAERPDSSSPQETLAFYFYSTQSADIMLHVETQSGEEILSFVPAKTYQSVVISTPELAVGTTYDIYLNGSSSGTETDGLYTGGTYTAGTMIGSLNLT